MFVVSEKIKKGESENAHIYMSISNGEMKSCISLIVFVG